MSGTQVPQIDATDAGTEWDGVVKGPKHSWRTCDGSGLRLAVVDSRLCCRNQDLEQTWN